LPLEDVEKKVIASAEQEAKETVEQAEAEAQAELERRSAGLREEQQRNIQAAKAEADRGLERDLTTRRASHAMKILEAKNEILDAVFDEARERILNSQGFDYAAWLAKQVRLAAEKGEGVLHCSERDRTAVEAVLRESRTDKVTLAPENAPIQGGVLLVGESFDLDLTLEAALADLRDELTVSLAERLFADVPALGGSSAAGE